MKFPLIDNITSRTGKGVLLVLIFVLGVAMSVVGGMYFDRAESAPAPEPEPSKVQLVIPCSTDDVECEFPRKVTRKNRRGELGHSDSRGVPPEFRRALDRWNENHPSRRRPPWWNESTFHKTECMFNFGFTFHPLVSTLGKAFCMKHGDRPTTRAVSRKVTRVRVLCGAAAALGYAAGRLVGAVAGAGGCAFNEAAEVFFNHLPRRTRAVR